MSSETKPPDDSQIGGLWIKTGGTKGEWMSGNVLGQKVVVFRNTRKPEGSNQPDFRILKARPKPQANQTPPARQYHDRPITLDDPATRRPVTDDEPEPF